MSCASLPPVRVRFDRGTLLLERVAADVARALPGVLWDERTGHYRAPAWRYRDLLVALQRTNHTVDDLVTRDQLVASAGWTAPVEQRPYQSAALCAWQFGGRRGVVVLPTGSGKTRLAIAALQSVAPASALVLVPTRVLLHQWIAELSIWYGGSIGCWGDGQRRMAPIMVSTFESGVRRAAEGGARFQLLVVDEAHHFGDKRRDEALELCVAPLRLGLTATPPEDPVQRERLVELLGPVQFELSIADLSGTYLARFDTIVLRAPLDPDERARYRAEHTVFARVFRHFRQSSPLGAWDEFVRVAARSDEGRRALAAFRRARQIAAFPNAKRALLVELLAQHRNGRVLVFTADNASAYQVSRDHFIMPLTCDIQRKERDLVLDRFRRGELGALVSSRVLNEGLDVPDADVAIVVGGSQGGREHIQRVGRLLRPAPGKRAVVYELVASGTSEEGSSLRRRRALATRTVTAA
jgi:superfamily II DNA or RNA helicase